MDFVHDVIARKRDGAELDEARIRAFVDGVVSGSVPSYQASALLMAMVLRGLSDDETLSLARALVESGKTLDLGVLRRPVLDKHSSGGVGDKVTLVLAPLVAACGAIFGKMSGRGLGHTGGTLDKLESIPGFRVQLPQGDFLRQLERIGVAVVSQSERIVPADRLLYALRDVTGTVQSDGLIAASIMAKKVASGTSAVVLDLKVGRGAFAADLVRAREIGRLCRLIGRAYERPTTCVYTSMDEPLGRTVGNRLEVEEAWQVLQGEGPADVRDVTLLLAAELLPLADLGLDAAAARERAEAALADGRAAEHFERWCYVQGGRWRPGEFHRLAAHEVKAGRAGYVTAVDALAVGRAAQLAGAGRRTVDDTVDASAGVLLERKTGDPVEAGDLLAAVFSRDPARRDEASRVLEAAFTVGDAAPPARPVVLEREDESGGVMAGPVRVVGGAWRGRPLQAPPGRGTRPTSDKVREAVFDVLGALPEVRTLCARRHPAGRAGTARGPRRPRRVRRQRRARASRRSRAAPAVAPSSSRRRRPCAPCAPTWSVSASPCGAPDGPRPRRLRRRRPDVRRGPSRRRTRRARRRGRPGDPRRRARRRRAPRPRG